MNVTQVFGHSGTQRVVHLDPEKTYVLNRLEGSMRIGANKGDVSVKGFAREPWFEIEGDTITGVTAVRAILDEGATAGSLNVRECEPSRPTMQDMKSVDQLAAWAAANHSGGILPSDYAPLLCRAAAIGADMLAERMSLSAAEMNKSAQAMENAGS